MVSDVFAGDGKAVMQWAMFVPTKSCSRPYACSLCGRSFKKRGHVQEHYLLHTGQRPFVCQHCNKGFSRARKLKTHVLVVHQQTHI